MPRHSIALGITNMVKFQLNGAGIVERSRIAHAVANMGSLSDNRFAVINGLMFEVMTIDLSKPQDSTTPVDEGYSCSVCVYDAEGCHNPSHGSDIAAAYNDPIACFEFYVSEESCENNQNCIDAHEKCEALFMHLIERALKHPVETDSFLKNIGKGLDLHLIDNGNRE